MIVQWYPGHMQKAKREILELNKYIDLYLILLDARAPLSSRNEQLEALIKDKPKIYVLNKSDLADETKNQEFVKYFQENNQVAVCIDSLKGTNVKNILKIAENLLKDKIEEAKQKGRKKNYKIWGTWHTKCRKVDTYKQDNKLSQGKNR